MRNRIPNSACPDPSFENPLRRTGRNLEKSLLGQTGHPCGGPVPRPRAVTGFTTADSESPSQTSPTCARGLLGLRFLGRPVWGADKHGFPGRGPPTAPHPLQAGHPRGETGWSPATAPGRGHRPAGSWGCALLESVNGAVGPRLCNSNVN